MIPNWKRFQKIVHNMIEVDLGVMDCSILTPTENSYDFEVGEIEGQVVETKIKSALIPINKDDLKDLPEGLREKVSKKLFTVEPINKDAILVSNIDGQRFQVIVAPVPMEAGGMIHCYKTFIGKIENV